MGVFASAGSIEQEVKTSAAVTVEASLTVAADATLATKSWLLVKKDQSVDVAAKGKVAAAGLLLEGGNSVKVAAEGSLKAGAVAVGKGSSTIEGSVTVVGDKTLVVYEDAKLVLKGGADASAAATADASVNTFVIQHAKRTGKFSEVKINGQVAVEASGSASAGGKRSVRAEEWEIEYGETETKFTKKSGDGSGPAPAPGIPSGPSGPSPSGESAASVQTISALV